jgi:hypothetical protein
MWKEQGRTTCRGQPGWSAAHQQLSAQLILLTGEEKQRGGGAGGGRLTLPLQQETQALRPGAADECPAAAAAARDECERCRRLYPQMRLNRLRRHLFLKSWTTQPALAWLT